MSCAEFSVVPEGNNWMVVHETDRLGPYISEQAALIVAVDEAVKLRDQGIRARASLKNCDGKTCGEYCLCKEFKFAVI